jgi:membrane protein implicated in regulation of membrane protease activity
MKGSADTWQWVWLVAVVVFAVLEIITPFLFFMISFAVGAALAAVVAFLDGSLVVQWLAFLVGSSAALGVLVPIGRRLAQAHGDDDHEGALRWVGRLATVVDPIPGGANATGLVRLERTQWRAECHRDGEIPAGTTVRVLSVKGTRLVVVPTVSGNDRSSQPADSPKEAS